MSYTAIPSLAPQQSSTGDRSPAPRSTIAPGAWLLFLAVFMGTLASLFPIAAVDAVVAPQDGSSDLDIPRPTWLLAPTGYGETAERYRLQVLQRQGRAPVLESDGDSPQSGEVDGGFGRVATRHARATAAWQQLRRSVRPGARVEWNQSTGAPHRVQISGLRLEGGPFLTEGDAERAARGFVTEHADLLTAGEMPSGSEMPLVKARRVGQLWFLVFGQRHRGMEVVDGRIDVRLRTDGEVPVFGSEWFPGVSVAERALVHRSAAEAVARQSVSIAGDAGQTIGNDVAILPVPDGGDVSYRMVHRVHHLTSNPPGRWTTLIDAGDGRIWARENAVRHFDLGGTISGEILPASPSDPTVSRPFPLSVVWRDGDSTFTDVSGVYSLPGVTAGETIRTAFRSPFMEAINLAGPAGERSAAGPGSSPLDLHWTVSASDTSERNAYYHGLLTHDYMKTLDPGFTIIDYRMPCTVNINATCNAFWNGIGINFYRYGGGCANTGNIADVVYHEYGHGVTQFTFAPFAPNGAMHEGFSDYLAATMTRQPLIGRGFFGPGSTIRTTDNNTVLPALNCAGQVHCLGTAVAGALWDMQGNLTTSLGDSASAQAKSDSLWHYAGFGGAPWYDDYLIDLLLVDDDDGTLLNGTPNFGDICAAFEAHGFECPDTTSGAWISHTPLPDADPSASPFLVSAEMGSFAAPLIPFSQILYYRVNGGPWMSSVMSLTGGDSYETSIPALPSGGAVEYYMANEDTDTPVVYSPGSAPLLTHTFHVGTLDVLFEDDFETDKIWEPNGGNTALTGYWKRLDPNQTESSGFIYQTEDDHTPDPGVLCYVTGDTTAGLPIGVTDVDDGCVFLVSPRIDLSDLGNARLDYWRWFTNTGRIDDTLHVEVSADDGMTWISLERQPYTENFWRQRSFDLGSRVALTDSMRLRVWVCDAGGGSLTEAAIDDVVITTRQFSTVAIGDPLPVTYGLSLAQSAPNPVRTATTISFTLPSLSSVEQRTSLKLYDPRGRLVRTLVSEKLPAGRYTVHWDGADDAGRRVAAGSYIYRLLAGKESLARKLVVTH